MKKILYSLVIMAGGCILSASAANITDAKNFSDTGVYTINRAATTSLGGGLLHAATDGSNEIKAASATKLGSNKDRANWSIHYSEQEKAYYLYNLSTGQFAGANAKNQAILTDTPDNVDLLFSDNVNYWMLDCGGSIIGLPESYLGKALFDDDITKDQARNELLCYYTIAPVDDQTLTEAQVAEIETKVLAARDAKLKVYRDFITTAEGISTNSRTENYLGRYDLDALKYALDNSDKFSLNEIEEIYQQTLLSRFPKIDCYYRLHNRSRPGSYYSNQLGITTSNTVVSRQLAKPAFGTAASGFAEDLCLVRFWPVNGDVTKVKVQIPAIGKYLTAANNNAKVGLTASFSDAYTFDLETINPKQLYYRLGQPNKENWLTISGNGDLVGYNIAENAMHFYIEPVNAITVPVDANGYATVCLPCGVELPEGVKAYTVSDFSNGKAYVEELASPVHMSTPFIIKAAAGTESVDLPVKNTTEWVATAMSGNTVVNTTAPGRYVPSFSANGIGFTYAEAGTANPGTAYIVSENVGNVTTVMGANPNSGIEEISADEAAGRDLYDLQGRKISGSDLRPGIYINASTRRAIRVN